LDTGYTCGRRGGRAVGRYRLESNAVIPGRRASGEPGIQAAFTTFTAAWIPGSREEKARAPE
jgi:hypothetical protein